MNGKDLDRAIALTRSDPDSLTIYACRLVVEDGLSVYAAARRLEISHPAVYRKLAKLRAALAAPVCPTCGQTRLPRTSHDHRRTYPSHPRGR